MVTVAINRWSLKYSDQTALGLHCLLWDKCMRRSRKFCQRGPTLSVFYFLVWWRGGGGGGGNDPNTTIRGPSSARLACWLWPNIECWLGSFTILRGSGLVLLKRYVFLWFSRLGSGRPVPLSGSAHEMSKCLGFINQCFLLCLCNWWFFQQFMENDLT